MADASHPDPVGFALIGSGVIAHHHALAIQDVPEARLLAIYTRDPAKGQAFAATHGITAVERLDDLLADPRIRVVVITTPSGAHAEVAEAAARAGKHVLCEKPLDVTLARADRILDACAQARVICCPVFQNRYGLPYRQVEDVTASGRLGRLLLGRATVKWHRTTAYYQSGTWRGTKDLDGGVLMNQAIHTIDLLLHLMGPPVELTGHIATLVHAGIEVEDTASAVIRFASGALGVIEATTGTAPQLPAAIEITGSRGTVALRGEHLAAWDLAEPTPADQAIRAGIDPHAVEPDEHVARRPKHIAQLHDLLSAIRVGRTSTSIPARDGRLALEVILGIYASAAEGKAYRFSTDESPTSK